ncbi:MAG: GNAT family N-acetyltransferase [Anaerolineales bacterium]|nr:GNAT family N-acetyltransferase [Anaerolineales bacterium]
MELTMRMYQDEDDYWRIREFLRKVFILNDRRELSWQVYRFDYWRWHGIENLGDGRLEEDVFLWETAEGVIAAVLNRESPGNVYLQVHPGLRTHELEDEMITVAEEHLFIVDPEGQREMRVWANEHDDIRQEVLKDRGYTGNDWPEYQRRRPMSKPIPDVSVPAGYTVRALGDVEELPSRSFASWKAFHPDDPDDQYEGWEWYQNVQRAPLYRRDLDIVAVSPEGDVASFCTVWFDDVTRTGVFEPVGTPIGYQRRGLGKAVMLEGLHRLKRLGATMAYVGSYETAAHALYESVGFTDYELAGPWTRKP